MRAFLCHESARDALRRLSGDRRVPTSTWPADSQRLPATQCVSTQRGFARLCESSDMRAWGICDEPVHLLVPSQQMRSAGRRARFHVWSPDVPVGAFWVLQDTVLLSGPEFTIIQLCGATARLEGLLDAHVSAVQAQTRTLSELGVNERPTVDHPLVREHERRIVAAAVLACEFAGTYRLGAPGEKTLYHVPAIMTMEGLAAMAESAGHNTAASRARIVADVAFDGSASPMETALALLLTLPVDYGGFGLVRPRLNASIDVSAHRGILADVDQVSPDYLWLDHGVALEYDSAEFHAAVGRDARSDAVRANILTSLGYRVFRATPRVVRSLADVELLARQLACALGTPLEEPSDVQALRRRRLYAQLMPSRDA